MKLYTVEIKPAEMKNNLGLEHIQSKKLNLKNFATMLL